MYKDKRLQGYDSSVCGQYCVYYLLQRCRGMGMKFVVEPFTQNYGVLPQLSKNSPLVLDDTSKNTQDLPGLILLSVLTMKATEKGCNCLGNPSAANIPITLLNNVGLHRTIRGNGLGQRRHSGWLCSVRIRHTTGF
jgi:hypothetical protein